MVCSENKNSRSFLHTGFSYFLVSDIELDFSNFFDGVHLANQLTLFQKLFIPNWFSSFLKMSRYNKVQPAQFNRPWVRHLAFRKLDLLLE